MESRQVLYRPHEPIEDVHFPVTGVASLVSILADGRSVEVASIGNEGIVGVPFPPGRRHGPFHVMAQVPGEALRMTSEEFVRLTGSNDEFRSMWERYLHALFVQVAQSAACNSVHGVIERVARWMLMMADRSEDDSLEVTHELLADMLGVRRASITMAAGELQDEGAIDQARGRVRIVDRSRLELRACECYELIRAAYADVGLG